MTRIHTDLSAVPVSVAPSPATSGTSVGVTDANAAFLPDEYPWWGVFVPTGQRPTRSNAEIVKVTAGSSSAGTTTFTITRAQGIPVTTAQTVTTSFDLYEANDAARADASQMRARAYNSSSQTNITDTTWTTITLDGESYDPGANFDSSTNYEYVIPVDGIYRAYGQVMLVNMVASEVYASGIWQATTTLLASNYLPIGADVTQNATMPVQYTGAFTAGQSIRLRTIFYCGANTVDIQNGSAYTYLEVEYLSAV